MKDKTTMGVQRDIKCPKCKIKYDEFDYEFQFCEHCGYHNKNRSPKVLPLKT